MKLEQTKVDIFKYGNEAVEHLSQRDPVLGEAIKRIGRIERRVLPDLYEALVHSVIAQQISAPAAETVWKRVRNLLKEQITPEALLGVNPEEIQKCGLSNRKVGYLTSLSEAILRKEIDLDELKQMSDEDVVKELSKLKGIGTWTGEMLLIFSMERPDVVSYGDLAILRGMMFLYELETITKEQFQLYRVNYSPYGSVASLYLWEISKERRS